MGYAEKIYEQVKRLPEQDAKEIFDFAKTIASRQADNNAAQQDSRQHRRYEIEQIFAKYQVDLSDFT
ncbi:MAG: hypothetical protein LBE50_06575, partial [Gallionellaceae bacterium]|nr:hypothetical protein [Gallionellaceae bacterium]